MTLGEVLPPSPFHSAEVAAREAFDAERRIKRTVERMRGEWVELAGLLYDFYEKEQWQPLGYESFAVWCAGPDLDLEWRSVYRLIELHRELVVKRGVSPERLTAASQSKVDVVLPAIKLGRVDVDQALADAESLGRDDLRERYKANRPDTSTHYEATEEPAFYVCEACGSRVRKADA